MMVDKPVTTPCFLRVLAVGGGMILFGSYGYVLADLLWMFYSKIPEIRYADFTRRWVFTDPRDPITFWEWS